MIRVGLIGKGWMGSQHAAAYQSMADVQLVASTGRAGWREVMADRTVDAVDVTFPTVRHREVVEAALQAGKDVFCETPLAETASEAQEMLDLARRSGSRLQVALLSRFAEPGARVRRRVLDGDLGVLRAVTLRRIAPGTGGAHHGDALLEIMLFDLDWIHWTLGAPAVVAASAVRGATGRIDHATALLDRGGVLVTVEASFLAPRGTTFRTILEAYGDDAAVVAEFADEPASPPGATERLLRAQAAGTTQSFRGPDPVAAECRHFVDVLAGRADPDLLDAARAVESLRTLDAVRSAATAAR